MLGAAKIYFIVFGLLTIVGGIVGYVKAGSVASVIAGAISGVLLLVAGFVLPGQPTLGLTIGLLVSVLLALRFVPRFIQDPGAIMPAGMMSILSVIAIIVGVAAWLKK